MLGQKATLPLFDLSAMLFHMKRLLTFFRENPFLSGSAIVLIGSMTTNVLNYAFNLVLGRLLSPEEYGEVALLVTLSMLLTAPLAALRILLTQRIAVLQNAGKHEEIRSLVRLTRRVSFALGIASTAFLAALAPLAARFFEIHTTPLLLLSLVVPASIAISISMSVAQGLQNFRALSLSSIITTVTKLFGSVALVLIGFGAGGVSMALVGSTLLAHRYLLSVPALRKFFPSSSFLSFRSKDPQEPLSKVAALRNTFRNVPPYFPVAFGATLLLALFGNIDVVLGKRVLEAGDAGILSAVAVMGRIITYGGSAIVTVLLPMTAATLPEDAPAERADAPKRARKKADRLLALAFMIVGGTGAVCLLLFFFFSVPVVTILFGTRYLLAAPFLPEFGLAMFFGSLSTVFLYHFLAKLSRLFLVPYTFVTVAFIASFFTTHPTIHSIVRAELIANVVLFVSFLLVFVFEKYRNIKNH